MFLTVKVVTFVFLKRILLEIFFFFAIGQVGIAKGIVATPELPPLSDQIQYQI